MKTVNIRTTWGIITLSLENGNVVGCALPFLKTTPHKEFEAKFSHAWKKSSSFFHALEKKFPRVGPLVGTDLQKAVWNELKKIPRGQTRTYGEIAEAIGKPKAVRAVGTACGANPVPLFIPCHRVVAKNGLGGFGAGLPWKKLLLELEGRNGGIMKS